MSDVMIAVIPALGVLIGVSISQIFELIKRRSEERRWYAEFFLGRKVDSMHKLYANLVSCYRTLIIYGNVNPQRLQVYEQNVQHVIDTFFDSFAMGSLYLNEEQKEPVLKALGAFRQTSMAIWLQLSDCPVDKDGYDKSTKIIDWVLLRESFENADNILKTILNPKVLEKTSSIV